MGTTLVEVRNPALDHIIERPRLIKLIEDADARIVLLCAPAGYGKTTLAKQWCARQSGPVAWYRTTRASGDVGALAVGLDEVLAKATNPKMRDPRRIESIASVNPKPSALARALASTFSGLGPEVLLVLDEWEAAGTAEADELVASLAADLNIRLLVTSRVRPGWFSARLEIYREALEVGVEHLVMTDEEAVAVLARDPETSETRVLLSTAGGWPVVLGLAAVTHGSALRGRTKASRTLYEYFATELVAAAPRRVQDAVTLLAVAAIGAVRTAGLVLSDAVPLLREAAARGLLTFDGDEQIVVHPLLREHLVERAQDHPQVELYAARLRPLLDAALWDEALAAAETLRDPIFIEDALKRSVTSLLRMHRVASLERWVRVSRQSEVGSPILDYVESELALRRGEFDRAVILALSAAERLTGDEAALAHLVAARAGHLGSRYEVCEPHVAAALDTATSPSTISEALWLRFASGLETGSADIESALAAFAGMPDGSIEHAVRVAHGRISLGHQSGDLPKRLREAQALLTVLEANVDPMVASSFLNVVSNAASDAGKFVLALETVEKEWVLANEYELEFVKNFALVNRARALIGLRRFSLASKSLAELGRRLGSDPDPYTSVHHAFVLATLYLSMGDVDRAYAAVAPHPDPLSGRLASGEYLGLRTLVLAAMGRPGVPECASEALAYSRSVDVRAMTGIASAIDAIGRRELAAAKEQLHSVLESGQLLAIILGLRGSTTLVEFAATDGLLRQGLEKALHESNDVAIAKQIGVRLPRSLLRSRDLSPRELEIHALIAQGMTNREIAKVLFISESTTKVHVRHILEKLGVRSRAEATRIWQEEL